jgi:UDP-2,3-diacylglucosamine hydrolase
MSHSLLISDLHLAADHPKSMAEFRHFVAEIAPHAEAVYILGDLFEYWAGDDDLNDPFHAEVVAALAGLAHHQTLVYLQRGNRDLLMGQELATACNATLLDDPTLVDLYGTPTLLTHGDTLCTDDVEYQRYREMVHDEEFQRLFLSKPLDERKDYIAGLRLRSMVEKEAKDNAVMDVSEEAVVAMLREFQYPRLIHGHTHLPGRHEHLVDGHRCVRWVLADWSGEGSALRVDAMGCNMILFAPGSVDGPALPKTGLF